MLRMTKVKLDLLTDIDQILMFESEVIYLNVVKDIQKQIINIWEINLKKGGINIFRILRCK